jgi:hypothetical protein
VSVALRACALWEKNNHPPAARSMTSIVTPVTALHRVDSRAGSDPVTAGKNRGGTLSRRCARSYLTLWGDKRYPCSTNRHQQHLRLVLVYISLYRCHFSIQFGEVYSIIHQVP